MRINRAWLNRLVEITWLDPNERAVEIHTRDGSDTPRGMGALIKRRERGILDDYTDGVLRVCHWDAFDQDGEHVDEAKYTWLHEALVTKVTVYNPEPEQA